jgi:REP element-mobilizing transposase RayT
MADHIKKSHNVNCILYHLVCPAKYRRKVFSKPVEQTLKETCIAFAPAYEIKFIEIGTDDDHVHFLIQAVPMIAPSRIALVIKSITAKQIFSKHPEVNQFLWGGKFWTSGYYINTVGLHANEEQIKRYVQEQGKEYQQIYRNQLTLF